MRAFSTFLIASVFALSVNTAAVPPSTGNQSCANDIEAADAKLSSLYTNLNQFMSSSSIMEQSKALRDKEQEFEGLLKKATISCCPSTPNGPSDGENDVAFTTSIGHFIPLIFNSIETLEKKRPEFGSDGSNIRNMVVSLRTEIGSLTPCLVDKDISDAIDNGFVDLEKIYA